MKNFMKKFILICLCLTICCSAALCGTSNAKFLKSLSVEKQKTAIEGDEYYNAGIVEATITITNNSEDTFYMKKSVVYNALMDYEAYDDIRYSYFKYFTEHKKFKSTYSKKNKEIKAFVNSRNKDWSRLILHPGESSEIKVLMKDYYQPKLSLQLKSKATGELYTYKD